MSKGTRAFVLQNGGGAASVVHLKLRWGMLLLVAISFVLAAATGVKAQSSTLRQIFEEAAAAIKSTAVRQPFADDPQPTEPVTPPPAPAVEGGSEESIAPEPEAEPLPPPRFEGKLPLAVDPTGDVELSESKDGLIELRVRDAPLSKVLSLLAQSQNLNIVASNDIDALISITLRDVPLEEALTAILSVANYTWVKRNDIILVTSLTGAANLPADVQGRQIQVFDLDFASATVVAEAVTGFLSPIGKVTVHRSDPANNRLTQERVIIEDLPGSLARIADFICQIDQPPRQVLIEAHVLQVTLDDTHRCGVNLTGIARIANADLTVKTAGLANAAAPQAFLATLEGGDLGHVIEVLQTTTDTKSLGSPKLLVLNEQEARIQVGEQLGFKVTTTTETSTLESVQFLDVGVVLSIIPRITRDSHVLMHVKPEVSTGEVNAETGLPEEETTELETDVMLEDGQGMVIGGLIKESDSVTQSKVPYLGDVKGVGWLFRRSVVTKTRVEIIIALVPRIQPYDDEWQAYEQGELVNAGVPLFHGPLCRTDRPWDPVLPDGKRVTKPLNPMRHKRHRPRGYYHDQGSQYVVPPYPLPEQHFYGEPCDMPAPGSSSLQPQDSMFTDDVLPMPEEMNRPSEDVDIIRE
ncbi:MAG: secretin and TonB N-terminal domain-containing protein [Pirellulales bacterium]